MDNLERLREIANSLDCLTEADYKLLTGYTDSTLEAHRKRGGGAPYVRLGHNRLYPRKSMALHIAAKVKQPLAVPVGDLL